VKLWIVCTCGRNLATVTRKKIAPPEWDRIPKGWTPSPDGLFVSSHSSATAEETYAGQERLSYTWSCRCGRHWAHRHDWIAAKWAELDGTAQAPRVIVDS
jgi:hypothetical protein